MLAAADVMTTDVITVSPETTVRDIATLLHSKRISGVPVVDAAGNIVGIVTEGDLVLREAIAGEHRRSWWLALFDDPNVLVFVTAKTHGRIARDIMTTSVISVGPAATLPEIAKTLERHRIKRVPVIKDGSTDRDHHAQQFVTSAGQPIWLSRPSAHDDRAELRATPCGSCKNSLGAYGFEKCRGTGRRRQPLGMVSTDNERRALRIAAENAGRQRRRRSSYFNTNPSSLMLSFSEIIAGAKARSSLVALAGVIGSAILGTDESWVKFLSAISAIVFTFLAGADPRRQPDLISSPASPRNFIPTVRLTRLRPPSQPTRYCARQSCAAPRAQPSAQRLRCPA